jgi:hypothetical protein
MPLTIGRLVAVSPEFIPASGGTVTLSFEAAAIDVRTRLTVTYSLEDDKPYIFSAGDPKSTVRGPVDVPTSGTTVSHRLTLKKSPPAAPREELVIISLEIQEVDAAGTPIRRPFGRSVSVGIE